MTSSTILIDEFLIGSGHSTFLTADIGQAHDGSLGMAHAFVDAAAEGGADAVKFQTHIADAESSYDELLQLPAGSQDASPYDYWRRMEFTPEEWEGLARHAGASKLVFLSSAFSVAAVEILRRVGMPAWKVASGEVRSIELLDAFCATGAPILLSTGMSPYSEIADAVERIREKGTALALFQCTSLYPTPLDRVDLDAIEELRRRFDCPVGLSDHSGTVFPGLAAMARGADLLEVHLTIDRRLFGPDTCVSLTVEELQLLSRARDAFATMDASQNDKDSLAESLTEIRTTFGKSIATARELPAGTVLSEDMLVPKKPATGILPSEIGRLVGRRLVRDVRPDRLLRWEDLEDNG